jgi:hypothetical protein
MPRRLPFRRQKIFTDSSRQGAFGKIPALFMDNFGLSRMASLGIMILVGLVIVFACCWFSYSAPPKTITITTLSATSFKMRCRLDIG